MPEDNETAGWMSSGAEKKMLCLDQTGETLSASIITQKRESSTHDAKQTERESLGPSLGLDMAKEYFRRHQECKSASI